MDDLLRVQVVHSLRRLPGNVHQLKDLKVGLHNVQVLVETAAVAPLSDDHQVGLGDAAHEEDYVHVASLPQNGQLVFKLLLIKELLSSVKNDGGHNECSPEAAP